MKILLLLVLFITVSCSTYREFYSMREEDEIPTVKFKVNFEDTWQAVLQVMQKYDIEAQNPHIGSIKTRWIDNTLELNWADAFSRGDQVKSARFKLILNVSKGHEITHPITKVSIYKRQMVERDFLQAPRPIRSDGILEKTILYRVERVLTMERELQKLQALKEKQLEESF